MRGVDCGPVLEDAARSRPGAHDRQEGGGRAADPLRHHAGVPAHLQPEGSRRAADAARVPRAERGATMAKVDARGAAGAPTTPRRPRPTRQAGAARSRASWIPEEDDELLTELERAAAAAAKAADATEVHERAAADRQRRDAAAADDGIAPRAPTKIPGPGGGLLAAQGRGADRVGRGARQRRGGHDAGHQRRCRATIASRSTAGASLPETPIYRLLLKPRACLATLAKSGERPTLARYRARRRARAAGGGAARLSRRGRRAADDRRRAGPGDGEAGRACR